MPRREVLLLLVPLTVFSCAKKPTAETGKGEEQLSTVEAKVLSLSTIESRLRLVGVIRGENEVLVFPDMGGRLLRLNVRDGQYVRKGQVVALIDRSAPGVDIKPMTVTAPASGYVQVLVKDLGAAVNKNNPIMRIVDRRRLKVVVGIPEPYAGKVKRGTEMYVEGKRVRVSSVAPALDPKTRTLSVEGYVPGGNFVPGQSAEVDVVVERHDSTVVLPASALVGGVKKGVFVVHGDRVKYVPIKTGITTSERVEVVEGLHFGDTVVVFGAASLRDGQRVRVKLVEE